jgi:SAM-dependent methyltransferase
MLTAVRAQWLATMRQAIQQSYDEQAGTYDLNDSPIDATHARFVSEVVASCPPDGRVLDAACGTGRYFAAALGRGRRVTGVDQSVGMVKMASARDAEVATRVLALQELDYARVFDAAIVIDAMEYLPPEDWPVVLNALHRAVRTGGHVYLTVELTGGQALADAHASASSAGQPVVRGEYLGRGGSYHYYPQLNQVRSWLRHARLTVLKEAHSDGTHPSYSYQHYLTQVRR